jgi:hypothetical protein
VDSAIYASGNDAVQAIDWVGELGAFGITIDGFFDSVFVH